jgi:hypothetical protein
LNTFEQLVAEAATIGRQSHAGWNPELWTKAARGPVQSFWQKCHGDAVATENYLRLLVEAIGRGWLTQTINPEPAAFFAAHCRWRCLLEYWLNLTIPLEVAMLPAEPRMAAMVRLWNLGENIARDQAWIDPFLLKKHVAHPPGLTELERQLEAWLQPVLQPRGQSRWAPPFDLQIIDGRLIHPEFLPGIMRPGAAAAALVCVQDRRLDGVFGGIFWHEPQCEMITHFRNFGVDAPAAEAVQVEFAPGQATINGHVVVLPFLHRVHSHLICPHGALLVSAVDSQRLWVIRSS